MHNTYKWGLWATAACNVPLLYMSVHHKSQLFVNNENIPLLLVPMLSQIAGSWVQTFTDQLGVNFDCFISEDLQMFEASLKGFAGTCTDSIWTHVQSQGRVNKSI